MKLAAVLGAIAMFAVMSPAHAAWVKVCTTGHVSGAGSTSTTETICWWIDNAAPGGGDSGGGSGSGSGSGGGGGGGIIGIHPIGTPQGVVVSLDAKKVKDPNVSCGLETEFLIRSVQYALAVNGQMPLGSIVTLTMDDNNHQKFTRINMSGSLQFAPVGACIEPNSHPGDSVGEGS